MCLHEGCNKPIKPGITHDLCEQHYREWCEGYLKAYRKLKVK